MHVNIDLKQIEKKAWTIYFQDGLWDIYMGLLMITIGLNIFIDTEWYTLLMIAPILVIVVGKRFITLPRLGRVKFGSERQKKRLAVVVVLALSVLLGIAIAIMSSKGMHIPPAAVAAVFWLNAVIVFGVMAYFLDCRRFYLYGFLLGGAFALDILLNQPLANVSFFAFGAPAVIFGTVSLVRFLRRYPKATDMRTIDRETHKDV